MLRYELVTPCGYAQIPRGESDVKRYKFQALVSCDDNEPFRPGSRRVLATLRLAGDDVADYLGVGSHFNLWLGEDVGGRRRRRAGS